MILKRIRTILLACGMTFIGFCIVQSTTHAQDIIDPGTPTPRYVLDKLNTHLRDFDKTQQMVDNVTSNVDKLEGQELDKKIAVIQEKLETDSWILKAALGGIATLIGKDFLEVIKKKNLT